MEFIGIDKYHKMEGGAEKCLTAPDHGSIEPLCEIGNDVWIGTNVFLLAGVKIGDGAIIGAGAIVTHDVEPYAVVGGVPAKVIRYRYPKWMIESFMRIQWWDWSLEKIEENIELFYQPELFCKTFDLVGHT